MAYTYTPKSTREGDDLRFSDSGSRAERIEVIHCAKLQTRACTCCSSWHCRMLRELRNSRLPTTSATTSREFRVLRNLNCNGIQHAFIRKPAHSRITEISNHIVNILRDRTSCSPV